MAGVLAGGGSAQQRAEFVAGFVAQGPKRKPRFLAGVLARSGGEFVLEFVAEFLGRCRWRVGELPEFLAQFLANGGERRDVLEFLADFLGRSLGRGIDFIVVSEFVALVVAKRHGRGIELLEFLAEFLGWRLGRSFGGVQLATGLKLERAAFRKTEGFLYARQCRGHFLWGHPSRCKSMD